MLPSRPFKLYVKAVPAVQTILEVSESVISVLRLLANHETLFTRFEVVSEKKLVVLIIFF